MSLLPSIGAAVTLQLFRLPPCEAGNVSRGVVFALLRVSRDRRAAELDRRLPARAALASPRQSRGQMISAEDCEFIQRFEMKRSSEEKQEMLQTEGSQENHQRVSIFFDYAKRSKSTAWPYFLPMLNRQDPFTVHMLDTDFKSRPQVENVANLFFDPILMGKCFTFALLCVVRACVRACVRAIMGVLSNKCGFQLQYQMIFSIWLLAFSPQMCEHLRRYNIIPVLSDILQESVKEKVTRIILAAFRNFLEKSTERETRQEYALAMIQCKVLKQLENLEQQKYDDEDISEDIKFLLEKLGESVQDLRILTKLLEVSDDPQVLAVAAHDVGEYVRHYPRGKRVIEQLGGKQLVMNHMHHEDQQVRYNALLAVQKLMVHNWRTQREGACQKHQLLNDPLPLRFAKYPINVL
ncbi:ATPase H+ transporting lysosomal V1 subunit H [Cricetulus griseus]